MIMHEGSTPTQSSEAARRCFNTFREDYYRCLTRRADELFELTDTVLCTEGKITDLAHLSLEPEHHRGYGALFDAINEGDLNLDRLRKLIASIPVPKIPDPSGREHIVLAVDVSNWLRSDAACSPQRAFCHTYARNGHAQMVPSVALLLCRGPGTGGNLVDGTARRAAPAPGRRRNGRDGKPTPRSH